jgi:hypothetical protein
MPPTVLAPPRSLAAAGILMCGLVFSWTGGTAGQTITTLPTGQRVIDPKSTAAASRPVILAEQPSLSALAAMKKQTTRQQDLKATYLYNFAKFAEWPESSFGARVISFRIEVIGRDPFDGRLDQLMIGKTLHERPVEIIYSLDDTSRTPVHLAFVSASEVKRLDSLLNTYHRDHVLTVSDIDDFTERGGMIGFVTEPGAVRFRIDESALEHSQLRMSPRLLALTAPDKTAQR